MSLALSPAGLAATGARAARGIRRAAAARGSPPLALTRSPPFVQRRASRSARQIPVSASCREPSTRSESEELSRSEQLHLGCRLHLQTASAALLAPLAALAPQALLPLIASAAEGYADEASSMPSQDDPVITVIFTLAVIALLVLTAGIAYLSIMQFLDKRQEEKDLEVSLGGSSSLKGAANGTNDKSKKARKRLQARNGKGFSKISK